VLPFHPFLPLGYSNNFAGLMLKTVRLSFFLVENSFFENYF